MGRPIRTATVECGRGLVAPYIEYIGTREPDNSIAVRNGSPDNPRHASLAIGACCLQLTHGDDRRADIALRLVRDNMGALVTTRGRHSEVGSTAAQLKLIAELVLARDDPEAAQRFQVAIHKESITDLEDLRPICRRPTGPSGRLAERALSSLATRFAGPGTLTVPTLLHHDQGRRKVDNADNIVVDKGVWDHGPIVRRVQLKAFCLGYCGDEDAKIAGDMVRAQYMEDIVLVSGHCDLLDPTTGHSMNGLARRLEWEAKGNAGPAQVRTLDESTLRILGTVIDPEPWRMGTAPMARSVPYYSVR